MKECIIPVKSVITTHQKKSHLKEHVGTIHEGVRYSCVQCDYQASKKYNLKTHVATKHEGVHHSCDQCDYKATEKGSLRRHLLKSHSL